MVGLAVEGEVDVGAFDVDASQGGTGFDRMADRYDGWYERPVNRFIDRLEEESLGILLPPGRAGSVLLDVGFGTGHSFGLASRSGYRVVGLDTSWGMLKVAASKASMDVPLVQGDAAWLPFPDECFDAVLSVTALEFFQRPRQALDEMVRCLKPGAPMVIGVLNALSYLGVQRKILRKRTFRDAHFYRVAELKRMLSHVGEVRIRTCAFMPPWRWLLPAGGSLERIGRALAPGLGQFIVAAVTKPAKYSGD